MQSSVNKDINELKQTKLWQYIAIIDADYAERCIQFVEGISPLLDTIKDHFPYYTRHNSHHSFRVLNRIAQILKSGCLEPGSEIAFSKAEALLLVYASYGHDLGMTVLPGEEDDVKRRFNLTDDPEWKQNILLQKELRKSHSQRGADYLAKHAEQYGLPPAFLGFIKTLSESHNFSGNELMKISRTKAANEEIFDLLQLSAIFCTGDLLEYSESRVVDGVVKKLMDEIRLSPKDELLRSLFENLKHYGIQGNVAITDDGKVIIDGFFHEPEVINLAYKATDEIESWLHLYYDIDCNSKFPRMRLRDAIQVDFSIAGRDFHRLGIRLKKDSVIGLISSNSVWNQKPEMVIRELLQNSLEACRYRRHTSGTIHNYTPKITVEFNRKERTLTITDNGCGMSRNVILNHFLTVGNSRAGEPDYQSNNYSSLARFGVGFWSVFTIAESANVKTAVFDANKNEAKANGLIFDVSITHFKEYTVFDAQLLPLGTTVILKLKPSVNMMDLMSKTSGQFGAIITSEIPIEVINAEFRHLIPREISVPDRMTMFGPKLNYANQNKIEVYYYECLEGEFSFKASILYRNVNGKVSFLANDHNISSINGLVHGFQQSSVYGFPFYVWPIVPLHLIVGGKLFSYAINTNDPKGFVYNINRQSLLESTALSEYSEKLTSFIITTYRNFLEKFNATSPSEVGRLKAESTLRHGHSGGQVRENLLKTMLEYCPDLICPRLIDMSTRHTEKVEEIIFMPISEIIKSKMVLISMNNFVSVMANDLVFRIEQVEQEISHIRLIAGLPDSFYLIDKHENYFFQHDPNGMLLIAKFLWHNQEVRITLQMCFTETVDVNLLEFGLMGSVQGTWSGTIYERRVLGGIFAFAGNSALYVNPDCELNKRFRKLFEDGNTVEVARMATLLSASWGGFVDDEIAQYLT
ncbi:MAG: ATP-binding protein [Bacteroidota bacterium]